MKRRAFTLVELLATLAIMALFAGLVTAAASRAARRSADRRAISLILLLDTQARAECVRLDEARELVLDPNARRVGITGGPDERWRALPSGLESVEFRVYDPDDAGARAVTVNPSGLSPAYLVSVSTDRETRARSVFVTSTGSALRLEPGETVHVEAILDTRPDAG